MVPEETTVFTVKLPAALVAQVRARARESGSTISAVVAQALTEPATLLTNDAQLGPYGAHVQVV